MRDWLGRAWDFLVQGIGGVISRQSWTNYKQWTDFKGSWQTGAQIITSPTEQKWTDYKHWSDFGGTWQTGSRGINLEEEFENPFYKFLWWWLRYVVFSVMKGIVKIVNISIVRVAYKLWVFEALRLRGSCLMQFVYRLQSLGNIKIFSQSEVLVRTAYSAVGILRILGQVLVLIGTLLQILGVAKVLGVCNVRMQIMLEAPSNLKVQGLACCMQYVTWQRFSTWLEWANATGGKWFYQC